MAQGGSPAEGGIDQRRLERRTGGFDLEDLNLLGCMHLMTQFPFCF